jgi:hypothetical protein
MNQARFESGATRRQAVMAVAGLFGAAAQAQADGLLDGRRFEGVFIQRGKTSGDADTLTFSRGRFRSSACDRYGYGDASYRASATADGVSFEAETQSPKYGRLVWRGHVRGDRLDATAIMSRDGKPPVENWIVAAAVR